MEDPEALEQIRLSNGAVEALSVDGCGRKVSRQAPNWFGVTCFSFTYAMINTVLGFYLLPEEADRLNEGQGVTWLSIYMCVIGATQLICPVAGKLSDRHRSKFGKRRPYIVAGSAVALLGCQGMMLASFLEFRLLYIVSLALTEVALNFAYAAQSGLPTDLQGSGPQDPAVSGYTGLHTFLGFLTAIATLVATKNIALQVQYPVFSVCLLASMVLICKSVKEAPSDIGERDLPLTRKDFLTMFTLDVHQDWDFFCTCIARLWYYCAGSVSSYMTFYIRDMFNTPDDKDVRVSLATLLVLGQITGAVTTFQASKLSSRYGRKPLIAGACIAMSCTFILYAIAPGVGSEGCWPLAVAAGAIFGAGCGSYMSVGYAIALDCLPKTKTTAEAFGLWGVVGCIGCALGPAIGGSILSFASYEGNEEAQGGKTLQHYTYAGFVMVMLVLGVCSTILVFVFTSRIRSVK